MLPYKWRVQSFSKNKPSAQCVAYIDARDVQNLLDGVCGPENWQDKYSQVKNTMVCSIGIKCGDDWVWKSDGGTETEVEAEKGELSDSFKRAAVKWGIGRFLYDLDIQFVKSNAPKLDPNFKVEGAVKFPHVVDDNGKQVWDITEFINNRTRVNFNCSNGIEVQRVVKALTHAVPCERCGMAMTERNSAKGKFWGCTGYPKCANTLSTNPAQK